MYSPYLKCHCTEYKLSAFQVRISEEYKNQRYDTAVHNCKNNRAARYNSEVKRTHHCVRAIYNCKMRLRICLVEYKQIGIESVRLD